MTKIAPNLTEIVGPVIAAKLLEKAGGVKELACKPSCNLRGGRITNMDLNIGNVCNNLIYECDLIQQIPIDHDNGMDIRRRAVKWVTNKCVLAARCDDSRTDQSGRFGRDFREKIQSLIDKELEPPPKKAARPLPAPIEKSGKKRGGKRVRRNKERYQQTELRKAANRMNFGDIGDDPYQNDLGIDRTHLTAVQKLRAPQINEKTKIKLSKTLQKQLAQQNAAAASRFASLNASVGPPNAKKQKTEDLKQPTTSGIVLKAQEQGLEIFNPNAAESFAAGTSGESSNYFSNTARFLHVETKNDANSSSSQDNR